MHLVGDELMNYALIALAWLLGWLQRNARSERRWRLVRQRAAAELADPTGTNDPLVAIAKASFKADLPRITNEAKRLKPPSTPPPVTSDE